MLEHRIVKKYGEESISVFDRETLEAEARIAMDFIVRWGMVAAMPDGEDSSGRQKLRLMTTDELIERAFDVSVKFCKKARADNFVHVTPSMKDIDKKDDTE